MEREGFAASPDGVVNRVADRDATREVGEADPLAGVGMSLFGCGTVTRPGFRMEMTVATHCARNGDFAEGVRALIIDKDNRRRGRFGDLGGLDAAHVLGRFDPPWPRNPLHDLEYDR